MVGRAVTENLASIPSIHIVIVCDFSSRWSSIPFWLGRAPGMHKTYMCKSTLTHIKLKVSIFKKKLMLHIRWSFRTPIKPQGTLLQEQGCSYSWIFRSLTNLDIDGGNSGTTMPALSWPHGQFHSQHMSLSTECPPSPANVDSFYTVGRGSQKSLWFLLLFSSWVWDLLFTTLMRLPLLPEVNALIWRECHTGRNMALQQFVVVG